MDRVESSGGLVCRCIFSENIGSDSMKMSEDKKQALYSAIHEQIMQVRIELKNEHDIPDGVDYQIAQMVRPIYREVKKTLNVEE